MIKMGEYYYVDVETTGLNPKEDKIITIQYQKIILGKPIGKLIILKEWESSEEEIVKKFYDVFVSPNPFDFIPVMQNHLFDFRFLLKKFKKYNLQIDGNEIDFLYKLPIIDLKSIFVIANNLNFKNSGLDSFSEKNKKGSIIPDLYAQKKYDLIEDYIVQEANSFINAFKIILDYLPNLKSLLKK